MAIHQTTSTSTARPALNTLLFPESDAGSSVASSPTKTPSRQRSLDPDDNEEMLTPRSRVRRLLSAVAVGSENDGSGDDGEDAGRASDTSSTDHEVAVPRKKGGLAALLKKRGSTTESSDSANKNTAASYESVRRKMLMQLAKGKTPATTSPKNSSSAIEDARGSARDTQDDDSDKENRGPRSTTRPRKSTAIGPFQLDSMFSDDKDNDSDNDVAGVSVTPTRKGVPSFGKDLSEPEMSDSDNDNHNTPELARTGKDSFDEISSDDGDFDDNDGVDNLRDLLHDKTFTNNIRRKREERFAVEAKKRAAEEMRKAQEKERIRLEQELEREQVLEAQLAKKRTHRKASKKALEEMNKETARIQRNRQLALQPVTVNKISKESLFAKFNFNPSAFVATAVPNSSSSQAAGSDTASTPPSSPLQDSNDENANESSTATHLDAQKKFLQLQNLPATTDLDSDSDLDSVDSERKVIANSASVQDLIKSAQEKKKAADDREKGKSDENLKKLHPNSTTPLEHDLTVLRAQLPKDTLYMIKAAKAKSAGLVEKAIVHLSDNDSDSDLEILPPGQASAKKRFRKKITLENLKVSARKEMPLWRRVTAYKSPSKKLHKRGYMTDRELDEMWQARIREQARKETEEKQAEILAKGGKILSAEEKKKEEEIIEDLLERERRNAEETRKREKRERRRNGEVEDEENFVDEEDDDDEDDDEDEYEEEDMAELLSDEAEEAVDDDADESEEAGDDHEDMRDETVEDEPGLTQFFQQTQNDGDNLDNVHDNDELLQVKTPPLLQLPPRNPDSSPMFPSSSDINICGSRDQSDAYDDDLSPNLTKSRGHYSSPELNRPLAGADAELSKAVTSFSKRLKAQGKQDKLVRRLKKSGIMKEMFDEHAEESDDEWKGVGGASDPDSESDNDEYDSELDAMVNDNVDENADRARVAALFAADELDRDEILVNEMIKGVHGGFRKRHKGGLYDLSDSDDEAAYAERRRQRREAKRRKHLLKDEKMSSLAENPKARAFFKTIEEDERRLAEPQYVDIDDLEALLNA
ncbi:MRC1-like domain-containing protein [Lipomyces chichibuensis]|uniref:MRC1-like domain-containing protein n=1 Tax=Lipomyces chichibuensis TaxID=1546026 RepID=UPI0033430B7A